MRTTLPGPLRHLLGLLRDLPGLTDWKPVSWLCYASVSGISIGINMLLHADDPHEIIQFLGAWLLNSGAVIAIALLLTLLLGGRRM